MGKPNPERKQFDPIVKRVAKKATKEERREAYSAVVELVIGLPVFGVARVALKRLTTYITKEIRAEYSKLEAAYADEVSKNESLTASLTKANDLIVEERREKDLLKHDNASLKGKVSLLELQATKQKVGTLQPKAHKASVAQATLEGLIEAKPCPPPAGKAVDKAQTT